MNAPYKTLSYFCRSLTDPMFEIYDLLDDDKHPEHLNLLQDLGSIDPVELDIFVETYHVNSMVGRQQDKEQARRVFFLTYAIQKAVAAERLRVLVLDELRPQPYDSQNFKDVPISANHLISTKLFRGPIGYVINDHGYDICPSTGASNSSYWLSEAIMKICAEKNLDFNIRLHPFIEIPVEAYHPMMYRMTVYGVPLDWESLKQLKADEFGQWFNEKDRNDFMITDFVWTPKEHELHFTCEELPKPEEISFRGSRYFHAIFDKRTGLITHCDGALRVYDADELNYRNRFHVRQPEVRKIGKRIKIFQIDKTALSHEDFALLAKSFFVWNEDIQNYFQ